MLCRLKRISQLMLGQIKIDSNRHVRYINSRKLLLLLFIRLKNIWKLCISLFILVLVSFFLFFVFWSFHFECSSMGDRFEPIYVCIHIFKSFHHAFMMDIIIMSLCVWSLEILGENKNLFVMMIKHWNLNRPTNRLYLTRLFHTWKRLSKYC